ncbi:MAG: phage/plasmid primase, P4 family [Thermoproteota archaeon]|nr:phage/plasmid primase, P4 family [Thermoproteota archaeon]
MTLADDFKNALNSRAAIGEMALQICLQAEKQYRFAYFVETRELRYYKNGWYQPGGEEFVTKELQKGLPDISQHLLRETIAKLSQRNYRSLDECDSDKKILNTEDDFVHMEKMKLLRHNPDYLSITQFPVKFTRKPKSKRIRKFLDETLDKKELRKLMFLLGDLLYLDGQKQTIFFFVGAGHNRKGTVARLLQHFVGSGLCCNLSLEELADRDFAVVNLHGKILNVAGDESPNAPENWHVIRRITGADTLSGEMKGVQKRVSFRNGAIIICVFNKLPQIDEDYSTWRRIQMIRFKRNFEENDDGKGGEFEAKLHTPECMSELLWLALKGRRMYMKYGGHEKEDLKSIKLEYKKLQDHVVAFISECYVRKVDGYTDSNTVYQDYVEYCERNKQTAIPKEELGERLAGNGMPNRKRGTGRKRPHCYVGIVRKSAGFFEDGVDG